MSDTKTGKSHDSDRGHPEPTPSPPTSKTAPTPTVGIPLDDQSKIFDPFYRAENVSEETEGSGLGLAITKTVVDNHRGRIWVDSKLGKGAMFTIVLPIYHK